MAPRRDRSDPVFGQRTARAAGEENRPPAGPSVYQFKVTLKGTSPPIWRRFQVTDDVTLYRLHLVLQRVMGWENCHLYQFIIGGLCYADPDPEYGATDRNARRYKLWQVFGGRQKAKAVYEYVNMVRRELSLLALVERAAAMLAGSSVDAATLRREVERALRHENPDDIEADLVLLNRATEEEWLVLEERVRELIPESRGCGARCYPFNRAGRVQRRSSWLPGVAGRVPP
ncbi:MAG: plasmid pRiA4b ORF-3 family protein [Clostridia bacterium]|nr:plasmid pRiA4b ORF-3 family protein [Clostridia bacterium]